jgi:hypothetical protein
MRPPHPADTGRSLPEEGQPADAFCPEAPCPRATTGSIPEMSDFNSPTAEPGVYHIEIICFQENRKIFSNWQKKSDQELAHFIYAADWS